MNEPQQTASIEKANLSEHPFHENARSPLLLTFTVPAEFIQPDRSVPAIGPTDEIVVMTQAPDDIKTLVTEACYAPPSNTSTKPSYASMTPPNLVWQDQNDEERETMDRSCWNTPASRDKAHECAGVIQDGEIPPGDQAIMHRHGKPTASQDVPFVAWSTATFQGEKGQSRSHDQDHDRPARHTNAPVRTGAQLGPNDPDPPSVERNQHIQGIDRPSFHSTTSQAI